MSGLLRNLHVIAPPGPGVDLTLWRVLTFRHSKCTIRIWIYEGAVRAVKTITIDLDAHELLSAEKRDKESFSKVIKRRLRPARTARSLMAALSGCLLSDGTLDRVEDEVRRRGESLAASSILPWIC